MGGWTQHSLSHEHEERAGCGGEGCGLQAAYRKLESQDLVDPLLRVGAVGVIDETGGLIVFLESVHLSPARVWPWLDLGGCEFLEGACSGDFTRICQIYDMEGRDACVLVCGRLDRRQIVRISEHGLEVSLGQVVRVHSVPPAVNRNAVATAILAQILQAASEARLVRSRVIVANLGQVALHLERIITH